MESRFTIYKGKDGEEEIYLTHSLLDILNWAEKHNCNNVGYCDLCGKPEGTFYVHPELGHKSICEKCHNAYIKRAVWYTEDLHTVFNSLITFMLTYDFNYTSADCAMVNKFFESKGHMSMKIEDYLERFKEDYE